MCSFFLSGVGGDITKFTALGAACDRQGSGKAQCIWLGPRVWPSSLYLWINTSKWLPKKPLWNHYLQYNKCLLNIRYVIEFYCLQIIVMCFFFLSVTNFHLLMLKPHYAWKGYQCLLTGEEWMLNEGKGLAYTPSHQTLSKLSLYPFTTKPVL